MTFDQAVGLCRQKGVRVATGVIHHGTTGERMVKLVFYVGDCDLYAHRGYFAPDDAQVIGDLMESDGRSVGRVVAACAETCRALDPEP